MDPNIETCFHNILKPAIDPRYVSIVKFNKNDKIKLPCYCVQTIYLSSLSNIDIESCEIRLFVNDIRNEYQPRLYYQYIQPINSCTTGDYVNSYNHSNISRWVNNDTNTLNWNNIYINSPDWDLFKIILKSSNIKLNDDFDESKVVQVIKDYIIYSEKIKKIEMYSLYTYGTNDKNYLACELDIKFKEQKNDDIIVRIEHTKYFHNAVARIFL